MRRVSSLIGSIFFHKVKRMTVESSERRPKSVNDISPRFTIFPSSFHSQDTPPPLFFWKPNAGPQPLPKAGATEERTLEAVGCRPGVRPVSTHAVAPARGRLPQRYGLLQGTPCTPGCLSPSERRRAWACSRYSAPTSGTERLGQILRVRPLGISMCLGTASTAPVCGLHHREWARPSRLR